MADVYYDESLQSNNMYRNYKMALARMRRICEDIPEELRDALNDKWPTTKDKEFWDGCAQAVFNACNSQRSGVSCRTRVLKTLAKEYGTLSDAEKDFEIDYVHDSVGSAIPVPSSPAAVFNFSDNLSPISKESPCKGSAGNNPGTVGDIVQNFITTFKCSMSQRLKEQLLNYLYKLFVIELGGMALYQFVQADFLNKSLNAMTTLLQEGKKNLLYGMSRCFERRKDGTTETSMPLSRMPFGLIDYNVRFFAADSCQKLGVEDHYVQWIATTFAHFGHKWMVPVSWSLLAVCSLGQSKMQMRRNCNSGAKTPSPFAVVLRTPPAFSVLMI
ncbi:Hypothetical predicted protein [Paramuricea clavata]|uniref:Uncharacterized protein n=1 Tax=Paramuricea clavata TaxID=317549 RepID=A0A6S7IS18_PARCT|nr:Hypothetical predicted protein [Paramuricea clavata]